MTDLHLRNKQISELDDGDVSRYLRQDLYPDYIVPEALKRLRKDPTAGVLYYGEMLNALRDIRDDFWQNNETLLKETQNLLKGLKIDSLRVEEQCLQRYNENEAIVISGGFETTYCYNASGKLKMVCDPNGIGVP